MCAVSRRTYDGGGQPAAYWALPFEKRHTYFARPGARTRDVSLYYTIQLASYKKESSAKKEAEALKKKGFLPLVLNKGEYTIVCVGNFKYKNNASPLLPELRKRYQDCFVSRL